VKSCGSGSPATSAPRPRPERRFQISGRKTLFFLVIHEIRHPAQIATAVRNAGLAPPGRHDLFFCDALE
jgi:uncharacterized damage-inducible protein DinB